MGDFRGSLIRFKEALGRATRSRRRRTIITSHLSLGRTYLFLEDLGKAGRHLRRGLALALAAGFPREEAIGYEFLGDLDRLAGAGAEAEALYKKGMAIGLRIAPEGDLVCEIGRRLASWYLERGAFAESRRALEEALSLAERMGDRREEGILHRLRGRLVLASGGRLQSAEGALKKSLAILEEVGARYEEALSYAARARLRAGARRRGRAARRRALRDFEQAAALFRDLGLARRHGLLLVEAAGALQGLLAPHEGLRLLHEAEESLRPFPAESVRREMERLRHVLEEETARVALEAEHSPLREAGGRDLERAVRALARRFGAKESFLYLPVAPEGPRTVGAAPPAVAPVLARLAGTRGRLIVSAGKTTGGAAACHGPFLAYRSPDDPPSLLYAARAIGASPFGEAEAGAFASFAERLLSAVPRRRVGGGARAYPRLIATSGAMRRVVDRLASIRNSSATVLLEGETGTGKGLLARLLHEVGDRRGRFVQVHCAEFPETLLESELFGHARGSFTGAVADKEGLFEHARGGTLFLDEVGDLSRAVQIRLLRVIEEGRLKRVGEASDRAVDVRVVAATHRDLEEEVARGRFRKDLFYRLHVIHVRVPALRDRAGAIPVLAAHFVRQAAAAESKPVPAIEPEALRLLARHGWPGNVRELQNEMRRAVVLLPRGRPIGPGDLSRAVTAGGARRRRLTEGPVLLCEIAAFERGRIEEAVRESGGSPKTAAEILGISPQLLRYKLKKYAIPMPPRPPK